MTALAVLCAMVAAALITSPGQRSRLQRLRVRAEVQPSARRAPWSPWALVGLAVAVGGVLLDGTRGGAVAVAACSLMGTGAIVILRRRRTRAALRRRKDVARASEVVASLVRIGHVPSEALRVAAEDCPVLARAAGIQTVGGDPGPVLRAEGTVRGAEGLISIAGAWEVSALTGAPVVGSLDAVTEQLKAAKDLAHVVDSELAAPRATGQLLAALPFAGLGIGVVLGGDPVGFLTGSPIGQGCLVAGVGLACLGLLWAEHLADRAADSAGV